jgi:hypothetical protein
MGRRIPHGPFNRVQIYALDGPANLRKFSSPKRPLRGGVSSARSGPAAISRDEARWVGFSSDSGGARRPGFPHARCRSSRTGAGFWQPPGMGNWNRGRFRRSQAPWSGIAVLRADTPARNNPVLGHSGVHRCGCRTRTSTSFAASTTARSGLFVKRRTADTSRAEQVVGALFQRLRRLRFSTFRLRLNRYSASPIAVRSFKANLSFL